jgi:hypothetical protein
LGRLRQLRTRVLAAGLVAGLVLGLVLGAAGCRVERRHSGLVSGNGVVGLPAEQIVDTATKAAMASSSVRITGRVVQAGKTAELDLALKGTDGGVGTVSFDDLEYRIVRVGPDLYVTAGPGAFGELGPLGGSLEGKPVRVSASDPRFSEIAGFTDLDRILAVLVDPAAGLRKGEQRDINGRHALALLNAAGTGGTLWVATSGTPYPLRLDAPQSAGTALSGTLDFLDYGEPVALTAPAGAIELG